MRHTIAKLFALHLVFGMFGCAAEPTADDQPVADEAPFADDEHTISFAEADLDADPDADAAEDKAAAGCRVTLRYCVDPKLYNPRCTTNGKCSKKRGLSACESMVRDICDPYPCMITVDKMSYPYCP